jgi:hypothetical protein
MVVVSDEAENRNPLSSTYDRGENRRQVARRLSRGWIEVAEEMRLHGEQRAVEAPPGHCPIGMNQRRHDDPLANLGAVLGERDVVLIGLRYSKQDAIMPGCSRGRCGKPPACELKVLSAIV